MKAPKSKNRCKPERMDLLQKLTAETEEEMAADTGPHDRAAGPDRLCIATRQVRSIDEMLRFVVGPDGSVVPDIKRRLPGV